MRLRPLTEKCPKPLLKISGRPIITYAMEHLMSIGVDRFIINTHHCPEAYHETFPELQWRGVPIILRHERVLLDTAGGLKNIESLLCDDEALVCYNGDVLADFPLQKLLEAHEQDRPEATLALRTSGSPLNVNIDGHGWICDIRNVLGDPGILNCLFTGIYIVEKSILQFIHPGKVESVIPLFLGRIAERPGSIRGVIIDDRRWYDIGSIESYEHLKKQLA